MGPTFVPRSPRTYDWVACTRQRHELLKFCLHQKGHIHIQFSAGSVHDRVDRQPIEASRARRRDHFGDRHGRIASSSCRRGCGQRLRVRVSDSTICLGGARGSNLVVDTPAFAASPSTNPCLGQSQHVPPACRRYDPDWAAPCQRELVENAEGRLIARQAKLSLKLNRRDAGRLAGDQISRPKPCAQRHMAAVP